MFKVKYISISLALAMLATVYSCKPLQNLRQDNIKPMPASFDNSSDTISSATINWKQYFSDKNLTGLIDTALINNWDIQMALQRIQQAQSNVLLTTGALRPFVNQGAATGFNKFGSYTADAAGNKGTEIYNGRDVPILIPDYFVGLQATWEIDAWGKLKNRKKAAAARFLSSVEGRNVVLTNLVAEIATTWYELLGLDQNLKIIDETIVLQENAFAIVKVQKEAAAANDLAVKQFEAQLLNLRGARLQTLQQIAEAESKINLLSGRYPQPILRDTSFFSNTVPFSLKPGIPTALLQNRPDIKQAELELIASKADVMAAKAAFYPSVNISTSLGLQAFKPNLLFHSSSVAYGLLGGITAPLINRSAIKAEFNFANATQLEALFNYQKSIVTAYVEVYNEMLRIKNLQQVFELKTTEADVLTQSIRTSSLLFRTGRANYLEVLFTQQNALQAKLQLIETKKNQFLSAVNMYKALGGGWR